MAEEKDKLIRGRGVCKSQMTNFKKYLDVMLPKASLEGNEIFEINERLNKLNLVFEKLEGIQEELEYQVPLADLDKEQSERADFENVYFGLVSQAKAFLKKFSDNCSEGSGPSVHESLQSGERRAVRSTIGDSGGSSGVRLPLITLPKFSGDYKSWLEFRDIFSSLIHDNESLSAIQKFHYLRSSLQDPASQLIRSLDFSGDNYSIAWTTLCDRYNNNRLLVHMHIKSLFDLEPLEKENAEMLRFLIDNVSKNLNSLTALKQETQHWGPLVMYLISTKLDPITDREWEEFKNSKDDILAWDDLKEFLKSRADLLETLERRRGLEKPKIKPHNLSTHRNSRSLLGSEIKCVLCKKNHFIANCADFLNLSTSDRVDKVKHLKLCLNCLKGGHFSKFCRFHSCGKCKGKHNALLHYDVVRSPESTDVGGNEQDTSNVALSSLNSNAHVLLSTVLLEVQGKDGAWHVVRALLDSGSQSNFITSNLCDKLMINKDNFSLLVGGLGQNACNVKHKCKVSARSLHNAFKVDINCLVLPQITGFLPSVKLEIDNIQIPKNISLADPYFNKPSQIDILIGCELFYELMCIGQIKLGSNNPVLQKTRFGWIISGPIQRIDASPTVCNLSMHVSNEFDLQRFWEIESEFLSERKLYSIEENECELHFQNTHRRQSDGRFVVSMSLKGPLEGLGESKGIALRRFSSLERKFQLNTEFRQRYFEFMSEYQTLGHMTEVENVRCSELAYYIPHHGVMKEESLTTKLRVVFDCSMKTSSGKSLNDLQMVGPVIQPDLISILLRFREYAYVASADIAKMYRQVLIEPDQRPLQRILWRESTSEPIKVFNLNTVTYGQACSSFLAVRCLFQLALECENDLPDIANIIRTSFYVDDFLCSVDSVEKGIFVCEHVSKVLERGCFKLRKWISNKPEILNAVSQQSEDFNVLDFGIHENAKTLGLLWSCSSDVLSFKIGVADKTERVTKRTVLSHIAQVFDPLGLLAPCIVIAKILLQRLWLEKLSWDESLPSELNEVWLRFRAELPFVNNVKIPRHVSCVCIVKCELHGFSDASDQAYGGVIYIRSIDIEGKITVRLLCAKSKVSPLKSLTTPRLEVCGALVLARLANKVITSLRLNISRCIFWSDSTIVLGWLKTPPNLLKTFVSSRVSEIQGLTEGQEWRHVSTKQNPADILSRGIFPKQIVDFELWWNGPLFLKQDESRWPESIVKNDSLPELRPNKRVFSFFSEEFNSFLFDAYSEFSKLVRITAWLVRFGSNLKNSINKVDVINGPLSTAELQNASRCLVKLSQKESFPEEYTCLEKGKILSSKSKILNLNPFLDNNGVIRVGGRLRHSNFNADKKHPMLISGKHRISKLICTEEHKRLFHAGSQLLLSCIRSKYWPTGARNLVKATVRNCVNCSRFKPQNIQPIMGDLPANRLVSGQVFNIVGVDYMGPIIIKDKKGRGAKLSKCYVSVFVCFATKALHLEVVTDLTSEAFLAAFRRFVARRGKPSHVYSDNGLNFIGANRELKELGMYLRNNHKNLSEIFSQNIGVQWHFIPAQSPHFGGLWEAGVKSAKFHLKRVVGNAHLTYEELNTLVVQIESILNSRPLTPISSDPEDYTPLTPAHFLLGKTLLDLPDPDVQHIPESRLRVFQRIQQIKQNFWRRWNKEYVTELQQRVKWKQTQSQVQLGSLILIKEDNTPPSRWRLGRIINIYPGKDMVNRVAEIKTSSGVLRRSFSKICPLPID